MSNPRIGQASVAARLGGPSCRKSMALHGVMAAVYALIVVSHRAGWSGWRNVGFVLGALVLAVAAIRAGRASAVWSRRPRALRLRAMAALILGLSLPQGGAFAGVGDIKSAKAESALNRAIASLDRSRARFEEDVLAAGERMGAAFDRLSMAVEKDRSIPVSDRVLIQKDLRAARDEFESEGRLRPILPLQPALVAYTISTRKSFQQLANAYGKVLAQLPRSDPRTTAYEDELEALTLRVNRSDMMQPGKTWVGYRSDLQAPPTVRVDPKNPRRHQLVEDKPVNVEFTFTITRREGSNFLGEIAMNDGAFKAEVAGTFDGVNLRMEMIRMLRGAPRQFQFAGQAVGCLGSLNMRGYRTDQRYTEGQVLLQFRN